MQNPFSILCLAATLCAASSTLANASCSDRPGTPTDVNAFALSSSSIIFRWRDTTRYGEIPLGPFYDINVTDGSGNSVGKDSTGEGYLFGSKTYKGLDFNKTFCFRIKARTEPGTQGCVSKIWSARVCATTPYPPLGGSTAVNQLPYGPDTCKQGYVWREINRNDHVCVPVHSRSLASQENQLAGSRRNPRGGPFGRDTCLTGFVWRDAFAGDHVCVSPRRRAEVAQENNLAADRRVRP